MATSLLLQTLVGLWRKFVQLRHPRSLLRHLFLLWQSLQRRLFRKRADDDNSRGKDPVKRPPDRTVDSFNIPRPNNNDSALICASRLPPSSFPGTGSGSSISIPVELPSRPNSRSSHFSAFSRRLSNASFLSAGPYNFPNASRSSHEAYGLETLPESPLGTPMRGRDNPRAPPRSGRSSRGSSRVRSHTETGIYTRRPSHESINRARVSPTPSRVSVDRIPEHEPKVSESTEVEFVLSKKFEGKKLYPTMFINRYERNIEM